VKRPQLVILVAALGFGLAGVMANHLFAPPGPQKGSVEEVRVAQVWGASLPDLAGNEQALGQWQGKVLVLNFWAPWCPPCRKEMPGFIRLQEKYAGQGLQFVGVALDELDKVQPYVDEIGVNYPILLGGMGAMMLGQAAGNRLGGLPYTLLLDKLGNPIATLTGGIDEGRLEELVKPLL
jgi:thiol-disulfide isomerase/thioredoxin